MSLAQTCPYCQAPYQPAARTPGRHRARCDACGRAFAVVVPEGRASRWTAHPLAERNSSVALRTSHRRTPAAGRSGVAEAPRDVSPAVSASDTGSHVLDTPPPVPSPLGPPPRSAPVADSCPAAAADARTHSAPPAHVPGYRIERTLGTGGMGTVYLARQLSLDRPVALKVMSRRWSADPVFAARFTREAYAAALLSHPNVVQIYDIGEADGLRFFSMEYVAGRSLADVVREAGRLDPETAVGYALQAARGLKHAHDRGLIHRDVKPDNLLLDDQGIVKVADLGLVKTPNLHPAQDRPAGNPDDPAGGLLSLPADMTGVRMALGTPAYMAPEQCRDAARVDHRADVYALGCTLYVLVTGRAPFDGDTAVALMTQHAYQPLVPPEAVTARVPKELSAVIQKMMAKDPADRFADMAEVIRTLEQWLGVHHAGTFSPRDDQIDQLEQHVRAFHEAPAAVARSRAVAGTLFACLLGAVLLTFFGQLGWAFGLAGMVLQGSAAYFVLNGVARKTYLFRRVRQFVFGFSAGDWAVLVAGVGLFGVLLWVLNLFWVWAGFGCVGVALAVGLRFGLDRAAEAARAAPLAECERLLRRMRLGGVAEDDLRLFVAKYAGRQWEEFFEEVFGYEAKLTARAVLLRGNIAGVRDRYAAWREPVVHFIDGVEKARKDEREKRLLVGVERERLLADGVSEWAARQHAAAAASALIQQANVARDADSQRRLAPADAPPAGSSPALPNLAELLAQAEAAGLAARRRDPLAAAAEVVVGSHVRAVLAAVLLAACALWAMQNDLFAHGVRWNTPTAPLVIPGLPAAWTDWCASANAGWAGVLLLASLFFRGNRMAGMVLLGAAVTALGQRFGIRTVEPMRDVHVAFLLGTVLALIGYRLGRR